MSGSVEAGLLVLLTIILAGPIVAQRFRVPGLIGLIFGGMLVGPFVLGWVRQQGLIASLGDIGLLYLMFLAGLSFNIRAFTRNRTNALVYGLLGFVVPFVISFWFGFSAIGLSGLGAALVGAMWASNTLVAYPEVQAAGLENNRAVSAAVSAGVVADLMSLTVLAVVTSSVVIEASPELFDRPEPPDLTLPVWLGLPLLVGFCFWVLPRIAEWFFVKVGHTRSQRFVFALAGMAAAASIAKIGGIEGLIGAFLAGLGLNAHVPARSALMDRLDFVGTSVFIPAFLVSIGLSIDPRALFDADTLLLAVWFTALVIVGKSIAATVTGGLFKLSFNEIGLMAALSTGQAASTLAIAQVGVSLDLFGQDVVNASILTVVATAFITSIATRYFAGKVERPDVLDKTFGEAVLVDVRDVGGDLDATMRLAGAIARVDRGLVIPYLIPETGKFEEARSNVTAAADAAAAAGHDVEPKLRVHDSFAAGTLSLAEEVNASVILLAWSGPRLTSDLVFGNDVDLAGERSTVPAAAVHITEPWTRVVLFTGVARTDWHREDLAAAVAIAKGAHTVGRTELVVGTREPAEAQALFHGVDDLTIMSVTGDREALMDSIAGSDLVVAPIHAIGTGGARTAWRIAHRFRDASIVIVGGPHRLTVSGMSVQRSAHGIIGRTDARRM